MKYEQALPKEVEEQLDEYIERIKVIQWFKVYPNIVREDVDKKISFALKAFGIEASIEYRSLKEAKDWDAARDAAWSAAREAARGAAREAAREAAWGAARYAAWDAAWGAASDAAWDAARGAARYAAWDAARGSADVLAFNLDDYKKKYPNGAFINLIPIWEMGLYPCGVINGKFIVYVPEEKVGIPQLTGNETGTVCKHCRKIL